MKKLLSFLTVAILLLNGFSALAQKKYNYESIPNDPLKARIYTLENGLKVYISVYKDAPRMHGAIAVRTGSKNDPTDNTGLSHYLEHMMFKGTKSYGTKDFEKENVYLMQIEELFEKYKKLTDSAARAKTYHIIDSLSAIAAKLAIANEYDKMTSFIGAKGTNAFTSNEQTVYINDVPANQLETWLMIESERFRNPVFRIFHTELETVYEEKNMSLDDDNDKIWEALMSGLFQKHTYGTQTTLGTIEHLKNPSLKALRDYYESRYVPNNMAVLISGDVDPDKTIAMVDQYFGSFVKKPVKPFVPGVETPITAPIVKNVYGPEAEYLMLGFRFPGVGSPEADLLKITDMVLANSTAGLIDLDLKQAQKVLDAGSYCNTMKDYSAHILYGYPKEGQKMEDVTALLLAEVEKVKKGDFPDWLIPAIINDFKLSEIKRLESNQSRNFNMLGSFIDETPWEYSVNEMDRLSKITKKDIVDFANKYYKNNYVVVYKRTGVDNNVKKMQKPPITPVEINRNEQSEFVKMILARKAPDIEPVFVDYQKDIQQFSVKKNISVYYKQNVESPTTALYYVFDMGTNNDRKLKVALDYLTYLGTSKLTPVEVKQEFYKTGCNISVSASAEQIWISISGLSENMDKGVQLLENILNDCKANPEALPNLVSDILKQRGDDKLSKDAILWSGMLNYGKYGPKSAFTNILSEKELNALKAEELVSIIKSLSSYKHHILCYSSLEQAKLSKMLEDYHKADASLKDYPAAAVFPELPVTENKVYVIDYDKKQVDLIMISKSENYMKDKVPMIRIFNEYFGGGMGSIVFQELRESKALAYTAYANYSSPNKADRAHYIFSYIGTQVDKMPEAMKGMTDLINNMPEAQKNFEAAKNAVIKKIRTERITKGQVLFSYENARKLGLDYDIRKDVFAKVPAMTFADLKAFQTQYLKDKKFTTLVLGKKSALDIKTLEQYGKIEYLTLEDIFGY